MQLKNEERAGVSAGEAPAIHGLPVSAEIAREAVERFGSPVYIYSAETLRESYRRFVSAFEYHPADFHYAIVCNKNPYLVRCLLALGAGIHANTPGDAHAALTAGVPPERIVYSGTNLDGADLEYLVSHGIAMNLDSLDQLCDRARLGGGTVGLRVLIDDERRANRIGVTPAELERAVRIASSAGLTVSGVHMYCGTNTKDPNRFVSCLDRLIAASDALPDLAFVNVGGGFGIGYQEGQAGLPLGVVGSAVSERMAALSKRRGRTVKLVVEPGRAIAASCGTVLVRVVSLKERGKRRYVGVDATVANLAAESVYHTHHRIVAVSPRGLPLALPTDVCGNTTHSRDYLGRRLALPPIARGDLLALLDAGAYAYAMSSHFLNRPRPPEVVVDDGKLFLTTRREALADLLDRQVAW